jgi:hypothetical protein
MEPQTGKAYGGGLTSKLFGDVVRVAQCREREFAEPCRMIDDDLISFLMKERKRHLRIAAGVPDGVDVDLSLVKLPPGALMFPTKRGFREITVLGGLIVRPWASVSSMARSIRKVLAVTSRSLQRSARTSLRLAPVNAATATIGK